MMIILIKTIITKNKNVYSKYNCYDHYYDYCDNAHDYYYDHYIWNSVLVIVYRNRRLEATGV